MSHFAYGHQKYIIEIKESLLIEPSVIRQKGESQNGCFKKTKHAKFSAKNFALLPTKFDRPVLSKNISSANYFFLTIIRTLNVFITF